MGRFEVMALLQAARYYLLSGDREKAYSFGLNRAIFYAWAKHRGRFQAKALKKTAEKKEVRKVKEGGKIMIYVGDEGAFISPRGWFTIGNTEQRPEDFKRQIIPKISSTIPFEKAWEAALNYLRRFSRSTLLDQQKFYEKVYKPVRDNFLQIIKKEMEKPKTTTLTSFMKTEKQKPK